MGFPAADGSQKFSVLVHHQRGGCARLLSTPGVGCTTANANVASLPWVSKVCEALDKITEVLIEKETISGKEFRELLSQYTTIPQENLEAAQAAAAVI